MLETQTQGARMEGADEFTELWGHRIRDIDVFVFTDRLPFIEWQTRDHEYII